MRKPDPKPLTSTLSLPPEPSTSWLCLLSARGSARLPSRSSRETLRCCTFGIKGAEISGSIWDQVSRITCSDVWLRNDCTDTTHLCLRNLSSGKAECRRCHADRSSKSAPEQTEEPTWDAKHFRQKAVDAKKRADPAPSDLGKAKQAV